MKDLIPTILVAALCLSACGDQPIAEHSAPAAGRSASASRAVPAIAPINIEYVVAPDGGVVLSREAAQGLLQPCSRSFPAGLEGYWQPTPADLLALESALPRRLAQDIPRHELMPDVRRIRVYRQYVGMFRAGAKVIYINGMPSDTVERYPDQWRQGGLQACGGGALFFGLVYTPSAHAFDSFDGNGPM